MNASPITLRPLADGDSLDALTALLHRAYAPLAAAGMNFTAVDQTVEMTRARVQRVGLGQCFVATDTAGALVGTVTVNGPFDANRHGWARATPWFFRADVAHLHQFAVEPGLQGSGLGARLMQACEQWALAHGHRAIALDTALPATHLRTRYQRAGYREVAQVQWDGKTYRSVILVKPLREGAPPHADDAEHRAAIVRTLWACIQARDWSGARALFADDAQLHWPASGELMGDADTLIRVNAIYPEGWTLRLHEATPMADGRVHSLVEVDQDGQRYLGHTLWRLQHGRIAHGHETWATCQAPPAWRTPTALGPAYRRGTPGAEPRFD